MDLLARQVAAIAAKKGLASQARRIAFSYTSRAVPSALSIVSQQPGNAGILARRFDASPLGDVFFQGNGYVAKLSFR